MSGLVGGVVRGLGIALDLLTGSFLDLLTELARRKAAPDDERQITAPPGPLQEVAGDPPQPEAARRGHGGPKFGAP
jgi:hypothetical protein